MSRTPLKPIGSALSDALDRYGLRRGVLERQIFVRWSELVPPAIAKVATPRRYSDGRLWLHVSCPVWRQELSGMRIELASSINRALGEDLVREIILR